MTKIYAGLQNKSRMFRAMIIAILVLCGTLSAVQAQVLVTSTGGPLAGVPTNYTTLKLAFDAINAGSHQQSIAISITANTTETATAVLNRSVSPANYFDVTIKPSGAGRVISGSIAGAVIKLMGADNVMIDGAVGAGTTPDMTIQNTLVQANVPAVIWVGSVSSTDGADGNTVKNCKIRGSGTNTAFIGIVQSSGTTLGGVAETGNNLNLYDNNIVSNILYGIAVVGSSATVQDIETIISNNTIGTPTEGIGWRGIFSSNQAQVLISKNTISNVSGIAGSLTQQASGIYVVGTTVDGVIEKNKISNVKIAGSWGAIGIQLEGFNANTNLLITNNFIWDIMNGGYATSNTIDDNANGIAINRGGGYKIWSNSIDLSTNPAGTANASAGLWIGDANPITDLDIQGNIFSNRTTTGTRFAIYSEADIGAVVSTIDYNDYYSTGSLGVNNGVIATPITTIANWRAATGQDISSISVNPGFISTANLHLAPSSPLNATSTPLPFVLDDIDGDPRDPSSPDMGADEFTPPNCTAATNGGTAVAASDEICGSGSTTLSSTGYSFGLGTGYQWQYSLNGTTGWTDMGGQTNPTLGNTGNLTATRYFRLRVRCNNINDAFSNVVMVTVNNPTATAINGSRCGVGTVNLGATGTSIRWYANATGGAAIGTGNTFTTPQISTTTTFYAAASDGGLNIVGGKPIHTNGDGGYTGEAGIRFDAHQAFTLTSVRIFPLGTGTILIEAITAGGAVLPGCSQTFNVAPDPAGVVLNLNFPIPVGVDYRLVKRDFNISITRDFSPNSFPFSLAPAATLTAGVLGSTGTTSPTVYYYFYDWHISTGCEGVRVPVVATVTPPPAVGISPAAGPGRTICSGNSITLTASSGHAPYVYTWNPGGLTGASVSVSPTVTTTYTVIADDGNCRNDVDVTVVVNNTPTDLTVTPANAAICANASQPLVANGGAIPNQVAFQELFNTFPVTNFTQVGSGMTVSQNSTYFSEGTSSVLLVPTAHNIPATGTDASYVSTVINLSGFTNPVLRFSHIAAFEGTNTSNFDFGHVEYSLNNGAWTAFPASTYLGAGTIYTGVVKFNNASYPDWDGQFTAAASTPGAAPATNLWKEEGIDLTTWQGQANFKIRFKIKTDVSVLYYGWLIDNVRVIGTGQAPVTWSPNTNLYMDLAHTIPYTGQVTGTVYYYSLSGATAQTYTATATGGVGCIKTATSTISSSSATPSVTITALDGTSFCASSMVRFQANPVNTGASSSFQWKINNINFGPNHPDSIIKHFPPGTLANGDIITVQVVGPAIPPCPAVNITSAGMTVTVYPTPTVSISGAFTVCSNAPVILTANATVATGTITGYQWFLDGDPIGTNSSTLSANEGGDYTVEVTSNLGCTNISTVFVLGQATNTITVIAGANGTITPPGPSVVVPCGDEVDFEVNANTGYTIIDILVNGASLGITPGLTTYNYPWTPTANGTIEAIFGITGCATPATSFAGNNTAICGSQVYTLASGSPTIGGSATSATWSTSGTGTFNGGGVFGTATTYTPSAADRTAGSVVLTITTNDPPGTCIASTSSFTLTLTPAPQVTISGVSGLCSSGATSSTLTADVVFPSGTITSYQWYRGATPLGTANTQVASVAGTYSVTVTGDNGCTTTATLVVTTFAPPTITISGIPTFCEGGFTDLSATVVAGDGTIAFNSYLWEMNTGPISGASLASFNVTAPGSYRARVMDSNGCLSAYSNSIVTSYDASAMIGTYTVAQGPVTCTNFETLDKAIIALNTRTIAGDVVIEVAGGYEETAPVGGFALGSTALNASIGARTISFVKTGGGPNPKLMAYAGGTSNSTSANPDGIWSLRGVDNVSITEFDLVEDINNAAAGHPLNHGALMEYGFGLFKLSATDGARNNTIQNCNITLHRDNDRTVGAPLFAGSVGIMMMNTTATTVTTQITPTNATGTNSGNNFYGNTIREVNTGIGISGYAAPSPYTLGDTGNDIGGTLDQTGNTIVNFGRIGAGSQAAGIHARNQWGVNISYNEINNNDGTGGNTTLGLKGIITEGGLNASGTISFNTITVHSGSVSNQQNVGIESGMGGTGTNNTVSILNNDITGSNLTSSATGTMYGIYINLGGGAGPNTLTVNNNIIHDISGSGLNAMFGIRNDSDNGTVSISNNTVRNFTKNGPGGTITAPQVGAIYNPASAVYTNGTFDDNTIANVSVTGATGATVLAGAWIGAGASSVYSFSGNNISEMSIEGMTSGIGTLYGLWFSNASVTSETIQGNTITNMWIEGTSTSTHAIAGMVNNSVLTSTRNVTLNEVSNLYTPTGVSGNVYGIWSGTGGVVNISKNKVHSLFAGEGTAASTVKGIYQFQNGSDVRISNNMISLDLTQAIAPAVGNQLSGINALTGIDIVTTGAAYLNKLYYNTIRIAGSGSGNFGSSAINISSVNPEFDIRNNIVVNVSTPSGTGLATALRRPAGIGAKYHTSSNNNLYYTLQTATNPIYMESAVVYATAAAFQTRVAPRETASVFDLPGFIDVAANDLHIDSMVNCTINGGGQSIAGYTDDIDLDVRNATTPDIGADEFNGYGGSPGVWKGVNSNWEDPINWCPGVPSASTNVTIPNAAPFYPIITTATPVARNITIDAGGRITIDAGGVLNVKGPVFAVEGDLTNNGTLAFNGTVAQSIPTGGGVIDPMNILQVNNAAGLTISRPITIRGELRPTLGTTTLNNVVVTLKSDAAGTAQVSAVGGGAGFAYTGTGKFSVELFINSQGNKSWRFLSISTNTTQTINQAWQEGDAPGVYSTLLYGMQIVGPSSAGPGFDINNQFTSLKKYDPVTDGWLTVPGTMVPIAANDGYMAYIRGDRSQNTHLAPTNNTTLRTQGPIKTGNVVVNGTGLNRFTSVGNPYPSAIDFTAITRVGVNNSFYVWDPVLGIDGGWQTITGSGVATPGGGSYSGLSTRIESGQAFMVFSNAAVSSVTMHETDKVSGSNLVTRQETGKVLTTRLYQVANGVPVLFDGTRAEFHSSYSASVDSEDAQKAGTFGETIGIQVADKTLAVEQRPLIAQTDTIQYIFGSLRRVTYELEFFANDLEQPGLMAWLEDSYLQTRQPVSLGDTTRVSFTVDQNAASAATTRFRLVFKTLAPLPVTFTDVRADAAGKDVRVKFTVSDEVNIRDYAVERSLNGRNFTQVGTVGASGASEYVFTDVRPGSGEFFYRIRSNGMATNDTRYSEIVSAVIGTDPSSITVYPNPIQEDRMIKISLVNQQKGIYTVSVISNTGQMIMQKKLGHPGGNAVYPVQFGTSLTHGSYILQVVDERKRKTAFKIVY